MGIENIPEDLRSFVSTKPFSKNTAMSFARAEQARTEFVRAFRLLAERSDVDPIQILRVARGSREWRSLRRDEGQ